MLTRSRRRSMAFQGPSSDRPDDAEADVGILNVDVAAAAGASIAVAVDNDTNNDDDTLDLSTSLYDVHVNLQYVTSWSGAGSCCASDRADGTTTTPALPSTLGLRIDRVGDLPLPLSDFHAKLIKSNRNSREIEEKTHHGVHSVPSKRIHIHNPAWKVALEQMVRTVAYKLGVAPKFLSAELKMLLLMEKDSRIDRCSIDSGGATVMGTLFIQLPSVFTGGKVGVFVPGGEDSDGIAREETSTRFDLGVTSGESAFSCYFVCHYGDCEFEIAKIQSGSRVLLQYSLHYSKDGPMPTGCSIEDSMASLKRSLQRLPPADRLVIIPMMKEYTAASLANKGINSLADSHRAHFEAIKAATESRWKIRIVTAILDYYIRTDRYDDIQDISCKSSVLKIHDDKGLDTTIEDEWLCEIVNFDSFDTFGTDGMVLADEDEYAVDADIWGKCVRQSTTGESRGWGDYGADGEITKRLYRASFILAYDPSCSDFELKCLSGCSGVAEATKKVVETRNYCLLERLLAVVENKLTCDFDVKSCRSLISMVTRSTSKAQDRFDVIRKIFANLSPSQEPDAQLYDALQAAVARFGHCHFTDVISMFLGDTRRKHVTLSVFLERADFVLKLNASFENEFDHMGKLVAHFTSFGADTYQIDDINETISSLISRHGWEAVGPVVQASLSFMHRKKLHNNSVSFFCHRTILLWKVLDPRYEFMQVSFTEFAGDFSDRLRIVSKNDLEGPNQKTLVKALCYIMAHGSTPQHLLLGKWAISSEALLMAFLEAVSAQAAGLEFETQGFLLDVLNECLVHNSIMHVYSWKIPSISPTPPLHIRKILTEFPNLPLLEDINKRLTLHHTSDSDTASFEATMDVFESNPKAASIRDPVTNLYPFMLAGMHGNTDASFRLLLANPSLVVCSIQSRGRKRTKRKRSLSV